MKVFAVVEKCMLLRPDGGGDPRNAVEELVVIPRFVFAGEPDAVEMAKCFNQANIHELHGDRFEVIPLDVRPAAFVEAQEYEVVPCRSYSTPPGTPMPVVTFTPDTAPIPDLAPEVQA